MAAPVAMGGQLYQNVSDEEARTAVKERPPYLHGKIARQEVEKLMRDNGYTEGLFLLRESTRMPGDFALSLIANQKLQHFKVSRTTGQYRIDDGPGFGNLDELIQHYRYPDDRMPVPLASFCSRSVTPQERDIYEQIWTGKEAGGTASVAAGVSAMTVTTPGVQPRGPAPTQTAPVPIMATEGAYAVSPMMRHDGSLVDPTPVAAAHHQPAAAQHQSSGAEPASGDPFEERDGFRNIPRVKEWFDRDDQIAQVNLQAKETKAVKLDDINGESDRANQHAQQFSEAALAEEKMYLVWLNDHLEKQGQPQVEDLGDSIKNCVPVLWALASVSEQKAPFFHKNPRTVPQEVDNWSILFKFMRKLDIAVDEQGEGEEYTPALDANALHAVDRREILKLFSRLLMFEASKDPFPY